MEDRNSPATKQDVQELLNVVARKSDIQKLETTMNSHFIAFNNSLNIFIDETRLKFDFLNESDISKNWSDKSPWEV